MTPKEKAKEIIDKYRTFVVMWTGDVDTQNENVRQCALVCVEEIMDVTSDLHNRESVPDKYNWIYWESVKSEIEKL